MSKEVNKTDERCCGCCCWFMFEDTDGWGECVRTHGLACNAAHCSDYCVRDLFVSRERMRHYRAVLLRLNRYRRDENVPSIYRMPDPYEVGKAIDFSLEYMRVFSEM